MSNILITGASSGIGRALAIRLAKKNNNLILVARRLDKLEELKQKIVDINSSIKVFIQKVDVGVEEEVVGLFNNIRNKFNSLDVLVNNAGHGVPKLIEETSKKLWDDIMKTNVDGVFLCSREAVKMMLEQQKGHIVSISSIAGIYGAPKYSAYCASKHAVAGFQRSLWLELRKKGIRVSTLYPAMIKTNFFKGFEKKPKEKQMISADDLASYIEVIIDGSILKRVFKRIELLFKRIINFVK